MSAGVDINEQGGLLHGNALSQAVNMENIEIIEFF
ncbi:hypothetical protein ACKER9_16600 [Acinetobacter baumannii]